MDVVAETLNSKTKTETYNFSVGKFNLPPECTQRAILAGVSPETMPLTEGVTITLVGAMSRRVWWRRSVLPRADLRSAARAPRPASDGRRSRKFRHRVPLKRGPTQTGPVVSPH